MKVLWHMPTLRRAGCGLTTRAVELARHLRRYSHAITFAVRTDKTDVEGDFVQGFPVQRLRLERPKAVHWSLQAIARRRVAKALARGVDIEHDLMISCQPEFVLAYSGLPKRRPVLYVCGGTTLLHDAAEQRRRASRHPLSRLPFAVDRFLKQQNEARAFAAADAVVFDSNHTREMVAATYRLDPKCLHTVHGGHDETRFGPADEQEREAARERLGVSSDAVVVVWTGRLSSEKNVGLLLRALQHCKRAPDRVLLVGDGPKRDELVKLADTVEPAHKIVRFVGEQIDVRPFLHAADIFAFPSLGESFGGALIEAMSCGLACIALRPDGQCVRNANREILDDGRCGVLVDPRSPEAFAAELDQLAQDGALRRQLGAAARRRALAYFTWAAGARRLNALMTRLCEQPEGRDAVQHRGCLATDLAVGPVR